MADIRIKDLTTTAAASAADDYIAIDGTTNGTRKLSAATPAFTTSITAPLVSAPASTNLTLAGGATTGKVIFAPLGTQAAEVSATGNLLVNTTSDPASLTGGLVLNGSGAGATASSTTTGTLRVTGGAGFTGAVWSATLNTTGNAGIAGTMGVGGVADARFGLYISNTALTGGASHYGLIAGPTFQTNTSTLGAAMLAEFKTAASVSMTNGYGLLIQPAVGATPTITTLRGISVANQGTIGITNAYGIDIAAQSGAATTNVGLRNAGLTVLTDTTEATTGGAGSLTTAGGIYAAKAIVGAGGRLIATSGKTASYTFTSTDHFIVFSGSTAAQSITLPAVSGTSGRIYKLKNRASVTVDLVTTAAANELFTTTATNTLTLAVGDSVEIISDGTYWTLN